jgi:uncharacterized protein (DUF486 family)
VAVATYIGFFLAVIAGWALLKTTSQSLLIVLAALGGTALVGYVLLTNDRRSSSRTPSKTKESVASS